jgi:peptidylprolyl isomerase
MDGVDTIERGEPPADPTKVLQASIAADNKPQKFPDPAGSAAPATTITPLDLGNPLSNER